jgi:hypothetical protein
VTLSPHTRADRGRGQVSLRGAVATWFGDMFRIYRDTFEAQRRFTVTVMQASVSWSPLGQRHGDKNVHNAPIDEENARRPARDAATTTPRIVEQAPDTDAEDQVDSEDEATIEADADVITPHASERGGRGGRASGTTVRRAGTRSSSGPRAPRPATRAQ